MISYINFAILVGIIIYSMFLLKHEGKVTQKHIDGDWRQTFHKNFLWFILFSPLPFCIFFLLYSFFGEKSDDPFLLSSTGLEVCILFFKQFPQFIILPVGLYYLIVFIFMKEISNYIYYVPTKKFSGCYVLLKHNNKYFARSLDKYPGGSYSGLLHFFGKDRTSSFKSQDDIFDAIFNLKNKNMIVSNFSPDTFESWVKWKERRDLKEEKRREEKRRREEKKRSRDLWVKWKEGWDINNLDDLNIFDFYDDEE